MKLILILLVSMIMLLHGFQLNSRFFVGRTRDMAMMARKKKEMPPNPVVLVTGASRGIGKAVALALGEAGCKVVVNYASSESSANEVVQEIIALAQAKGGGAIAVKANCGKVEEVQAMFNKVNEEVAHLVEQTFALHLLIDFILLSRAVWTC